MTFEETKEKVRQYAEKYATRKGFLLNPTRKSWIWYMKDLQNAANNMAPNIAHVESFSATSRKIEKLSAPAFIMKKKLKKTECVIALCFSKQNKFILSFFLSFVLVFIFYIIGYFCIILQPRLLSLINSFRHRQRL
jgi:hypothetical protein